MEDQPLLSVEKDALSRLRAYIPALSPSEKKVGEYILENPESIIRMTLAEITQRTGVSDATAVRFCRSVGYEGWLEFKIALTRSLPKNLQIIQRDVNNADSAEMIAHKVFEGSKQALDDTLAMLDEATLTQAIDLLAAANRILIVGVGTSGPMAHEVFNRFFRLGLNCLVQTDSLLQVMQCSLLKPGDVLLIISQSGASTDPRRTAFEAHRLGIPIICITGNTISPLTEIADVVLLSVSQESSAETMASRIAQYALIHTLYTSLAMRSIDRSIENEQIIWDALTRNTSFQNKGV